MDLSQIALTVRQVLLRGVLKGTAHAALENSTPLLTGGVLDSIRMLTMISDLEREFGISFEAFEMSADYLDSIEHISRTIQGKQAK